MLTASHFMAVAQVVATAGTCSRRQVGVVLVKDRRIIATGYNGAPAGMDHCDHENDPFSKPDQVEMGCYRAVHAELNAIAFSARHGITTEQATLFTTDEPCLRCAQAIINAGIKAVLFMREYRLHDGKELLEAADVPVGQISRPELFPMSPERGDQSGVHSRESSDEAGFKAYWQGFYNIDPEGEAPPFSGR